MLPDNILLEIFDFYRKSRDYRYENSIRLVWEWHLLVHVCQRWRRIVFSSPHRLNLQILCTYGTPSRKNLDIWPSFPIIIDYCRPSPGANMTPNDEDNVIAALESERLHRVCSVGLYATGSQLGRIATVMQEPSPMLKCLEISSEDENMPVLPDGFLGGSAPCLQAIYLHGIPFPALPTLLLSASGLVALSLRNIPPTGYISPEAMVVALAALHRLEIFVIELQLPIPRPDQIHPPPLARTVLPALFSFRFRGPCEYLEDLVSRIEALRLDQIFIVYLNQTADFQVAQFSKFVNRSVGAKSNPFGHAQVNFFSSCVAFTTYHHAYHPPCWDRHAARTVVSCTGIDWQVSHMAQVLSQFSTTLSNVAHLTLKAQSDSEGRRLEGTDGVEWLHLLHQFSTVQTLHVSQGLAGHIALALENITGEMAVEMLPSLDLICLEGQPASSIEKLLAARRLSDRPVTIVHTKAEFNKRLRSSVIK